MTMTKPFSFFIDLNDIVRERCGRDVGAMEIYAGAAACLADEHGECMYLPLETAVVVPPDYTMEQVGTGKRADGMAVLVRWTLPGYADCSEWTFCDVGHDSLHPVLDALDDMAGDVVDVRGMNRAMRYVRETMADAGVWSASDVNGE